MEDIDDDFGYLYADVEGQASSAINGVSGLPQLCSENNDNDLVKEINCSDLNRVDSIGVDDEAESEDNEENGSDSEDDLNIVLNEDDDGLEIPVTRGVNSRNGGDEDENKDEEERDGFSGKNRKFIDHLQGGDRLEQSSNGGERGNGGKNVYHLQYKYMRPHPSAFASTSKGNRCEGTDSYSSPSVRGDQEDNGCYQRMRSSLLGGQSLHQFSLPRSRTIADVNIDTFEEKPWRHPGANITDFFNFGFDEDSWKQYCNHLDRYRHGEIRPTRILASESSKRNGYYEAGSERETVIQAAAAESIQRGHGRRVSLTSKIPSREQKHSEMQKGRAIQVKDSISERQSSMDVRRPLDRDSDVVIQINFQDSKEDSSGSVKEEVGHIDSSEREAYENGDFGIDDGIDGLSSGGFSEDELHKDSLDGHDEELDTPVSKRCSLQTAAYKPVSLDSYNHGSVQSSDVNAQNHEEVALCDSQGAAKAIETSKNSKEEISRSTCNKAPFISGEDTSQDERSQCSPSSSYSGSDCEAFTDGVYIDTEKSLNHVKRLSPKSLTDLQKSVTSDYYHLKDSRSHDVKIKRGDYKYSATHRSPIQEGSKHHSRSLHGMSGLKTHLNDEEATPISETEGLYDVHHSARGHSRQEEKLHGFNSYHGDDFSYYKEAESSFNCNGERFPDYWVKADCTKYPHRKGQRRFRVDTDRYLHRYSDEGAYFLEQKMSGVDDKMMARDWYYYESGLAVDSRHPLNCQKSRQLNLNCLENERDARWKRKGGEPQFRKRMRNNEFSLERKYIYGPPQQKYKRSVPCDGRGRNNFKHKYEGHLPRETKSPGSSRRRYKGDEDDFWRSWDHRSFSSHSYREPPIANSRRWHGNDVYERDGRRGRYNRHIWAERSRDSDLGGGYTEAFDTEENINDPDDHVYSVRRRHHWQSELLYWTGDDSITRHRNNKFNAETTSFSCERTSWPKRFDAEHGSDHVRNRIDDRQVEKLNCKLTSEGDRSNRCDRNSYTFPRGNHEQTLLTCGDSDDSHLVGGEGKSSGRFSAARNVMYNGRQDNMDWNFDDVEQSMLIDFKMVGQDQNPEVEICQNDEKWLDKFPDTQHNEGLDIEEGQILTDEIYENAMENNICASDDVAQTSDVKGLHNENATNGNMADEGYDNPRILEVIAKMEKRRERFKEPITLKEKMSKPLVDSVDEIRETKQQRPARKRRWGGS